MTRHERAWCWQYAALVVVLTTLPYLVAYASEAGSWRFSGFLIGVEDGNSYIAKMRLGAEGAWLFRTPYTTASQQGALAFLPYLVLGKLAGGSEMHGQLVALFQLFRVTGIPLLVFGVYRLASTFVAETSWRRWTVVLSTMGGGLGWLLVLLGQTRWLGSLPLDVYSPETFGFLAVFGLPHLVVARALLVWGLGEYLGSRDQPARAWRAGAAWLAMGLFQPLALVSVYAVLTAHAVTLAGHAWRRRSVSAAWGWWASGLRAALVPFPLVLYTFVAFSLDPFLAAWTAQNMILSPHPAHYVVAYGLLLVPAAAGARQLMARLGEPALLLVAWIVALPALAYAPHNLQRRLPEGLWVALAILAAVGLERWTRGGRSGARVRQGVAVVSLLTTGLLLAGAIQVAVRPAEPAFRPADEVDAIRRLDSMVNPGDVVLASFDTGNVLPAWGSVRVLIGHGPESVDLVRTREAVSRVYELQTDDSERLALLEAHHVRFVWWGPLEQRLGAWSPAASSFLTPRISGAAYEVYELITP